jgi:ribosomal protein S27AE
MYDIKDFVLEEECPECGATVIEAEFSDSPSPDDTISGFICEKECGFEGVWVDVIE